MRLIIGLGNPDKNYQNTRHNLGQIIIKQLAFDLNIKFKNNPKLFSSLAQTTGQGSNEKNVLAYTQEYMNNSGVAIQAVTNYYKISLENVYVIHDDLDLRVGEYRFQFDRGPAGHNGVQSTIDHLGTQQFHRIRVGIGRPIDQTSVEKYVLLPFSPEERAIIDTTIKKIVENLKDLLLVMGP